MLGRRGCRRTERLKASDEETNNNLNAVLQRSLSLALKCLQQQQLNTNASVRAPTSRSSMSQLELVSQVFRLGNKAEATNSVYKAPDTELSTNKLQ